jgi:hypothetical protein
MAIGLPIVSKFDDKGIKQAGKAIGDFGSGLKKIAGLLAAAFAVDKIVDFAKEAVIAAEGVQQANNRLGAINESMNLFGENTGAVTQRMIDFAESQEMLLGTDAEIIKQTQAKLLTFKNLAASADDTGGAFDRATVAAIDLAEAGFGEATSNATQLGKALQDPIKGISALSRVGVTFTDDQKKLITQLVNSNDMLGAQEIILGAIEEQVGGTAEATATASEKMDLAFGNLQEQVGEALLPVFEDLVEVLIPLAEKIGPQLAQFFEDMSPYLQDAVEWFGQMAEGSLPLVSGFFEDLKTAIDGIGELLAPLFEEGGAFPAMGEIFGEMEEPLGAVVDFLTTLAETVLTQINDIISSEEFKEAMIALGGGFEEVAKQLDILLKQEITQWLLDMTGPAVIAGLDFLNWQMERLAIALEAVNYMMATLSGNQPDMSFLEKFEKFSRFVGGPSFTPEQYEQLRQQGFAEGGIVLPRAGGVNAIIGERGEAEAVLPLSKLPQLMGEMSGGAKYEIIINAGVGSDPVAIGRYVTDAIKRYESVSGRVFARA